MYKNKKFMAIFDMDDVLVDWNRGIREVFIKLFPGVPYIEQAERKHWWYPSNYDELIGEVVRRIPFEKGFFRNLHPKPGGLEALRWSVDQGYGTVICTSPLWTSNAAAIGTCIGEKAFWLEEYVSSFAKLFVPEADIHTIFTHDKTLIHGDILIDDKPDITGWATPSWKHLLFDEGYGYNADTKLPTINWSNYKEVITKEFELWKQKQETSQ